MRDRGTTRCSGTRRGCRCSLLRGGVPPVGVLGHRARGWVFRPHRRRVEPCGGRAVGHHRRGAGAGMVAGADEHAAGQESSGVGAARRRRTRGGCCSQPRVHAAAQRIDVDRYRGDALDRSRVGHHRNGRCDRRSGCRKRCAAAAVAHRRGCGRRLCRRLPRAVEFIDPQILRLTFTEPIAPVDEVNPKRFRLSVGRYIKND